MKAAELLSHCSHMKLLARRVAGYGANAPTQFKLDTTSQLSVPKWGKVRGAWAWGAGGRGVGWVEAWAPRLALGGEAHG